MQSLSGAACGLELGRLRSPSRSAIACRAFVFRLTSTCCSWLVSAHTGGKPGAMSLRIFTSATCRSPNVRASTPSVSSARSTCVFSSGIFRPKVSRPRTTDLAALTASRMRRTFSWTASGAARHQLAERGQLGGLQHLLLGEREAELLVLHDFLEALRGRARLLEQAGVVDGIRRVGHQRVEELQVGRRERLHRNPGPALLL